MGILELEDFKSKAITDLLIDDNPHALESIGPILDRTLQALFRQWNRCRARRRRLEEAVTPQFNPTLSLELDGALHTEECTAEKIHAALMAGGARCT